MISSITLQAEDMYSVAEKIGHGYHGEESASITDKDIAIAYSVVCTLPFLYCPMYLIREARAIRDKKEGK